MNKRKINAFGVHYLLGEDKNGTKYWLESESWDCGWYWSFGYVHTFTNNRSPENSRDISMHTHFDSFFSHLGGTRDGKSCNLYDGFRSVLVKTPFADDEIWGLCDLFSSAYTIKKSAVIFRNGCSNYSGKVNPVLKTEEYAQTIETKMLPSIFALIKNIVSPEDE